ncbi:Blue-light-activated histidine kinase [Methylobacterium adhaesivum]|jgi:two-component sensor histidine kinase|uniref:histidine kinase n=1 Tax=Methylobacterium adhaesivum TaxID=333297 RepID=A0ABT8BC81_9HYPH|nr:sensor histidine kinase [Methylobacterium adhaesivum]MDN3589652.1 sensor histidine kinase [Methylobacterium adhaesivum]GJD30669.1 Blue-light-activated histidine kinase [Methylobacterium adhaesivum]
MTQPDDTAGRIAALESDNARLRRLLDKAGAHDGLRHGLRDTVAMLRAVMHQSAETAEDIPSYVAHLDGRLDALMRARTAIDALGEVNLHSMISDALQLHLVREGDRATISGPRVLLRPKAAQIFALALYELASNAIEHGELGGAHGRVAVSWEVTQAEGAEPMLTLVWTETGGAPITPPTRSGFGATVLERTLAYELDARTRLAYEPEGLCCTIRLPLVKRIGHLTAEITPDFEDGDGAA